MRALLSVYDKSGLEDIAKGLRSLGVELLASGGTSAVLSSAGIEHQKVEDLTGFAEMFDGRVKTLHPKIHGAILADRSKASHLGDLDALGVEAIDMVVSNLYPFSSAPSIELIDIGGPAMVRGAAKNHQFVTILVDPADYDRVLGEISEHGETTIETRKWLAAKAFGHTSSYDAAVASWLEDSDESPLEDRIELSLRRVSALRYGENPHQVGGLYTNQGGSIWNEARWLGGPEPSYLNVFDADAAWRLAHEVSDAPSVAIIKHANPCGVATAADIATAYQRAFDCDAISAFGGIVAFNRPIDEELASQILARPKADVIIAPSYEDGVIEMLNGKRKNLRLLQLGVPGVPNITVRSVGDAFLVQDPDVVEDVSDLRSVTPRPLSDEELADLDLAWKVCARSSSNAITVVNALQAVGIGCGQQNRVDSARLAVTKAGDRAKGAVAASDAFFPFSDGLETLAMAGVVAVIAPSGSIRDSEIASRAEELGISYLFASNRHFRH